MNPRQASRNLGDEEQSHVIHNLNNSGLILELVPGHDGHLRELHPGNMVERKARI